MLKSSSACMSPLVRATSALAHLHILHAKVLLLMMIVALSTTSVHPFIGLRVSACMRTVSRALFGYRLGAYACHIAVAAPPNMRWLNHAPDFWRLVAQK